MDVEETEPEGREGPEFRSVGVEILCHPELADDIVCQLGEAVAEILQGPTDDEASDYSIVCLCMPTTC